MCSNQKIFSLLLAARYIRADSIIKFRRWRFVLNPFSALLNKTLFNKLIAFSPAICWVESPTYSPPKKNKKKCKKKYFYRVPQSLIHFGVLEYSDELMEKLKRGPYSLIRQVLTVPWSKQFLNFI